jgi:hypothetical protein
MANRAKVHSCMRPILFMVVALAGCGPQPAVLVEPFEGHSLTTQPAGDRAYWVSGDSVFGVTRGAEPSPVPVTSALGTPARGSLLVDDRYVFVIDEVTGRLVRTTRTGARVEFENRCTGELISDGEELLCMSSHWVQSGPRLLTVSKEDGRVVRATPVPFVLLPVATNGTHLFFAGRDSIWSVDKTTEVAAELVPAGIVRGLAVAGATLYWLDERAGGSEQMRLRSLSLVSGELAEHLSVPRGGGLEAKGDSLYFTSGGTTLQRFDIFGRQLTVLGHVSQVHAWAVTDTSVVVAEQNRLIAFDR